MPHKNRLLLLLLPALLGGCAGLSLQAGGSLTVDAQPIDARHNMATDEILLTRHYGTADLSVGLRHLSDTGQRDLNGGTNGLVIEMRQTLMEF